MKRIVFFLLIAPLLLSSCAELLNIATQIPATPGITKPSPTVDDIAAGLKEALRIGAEKSAMLASKEDGFYKNPRLFIPFPAEAAKVEEVLLKAGITKPIDDFNATMNRAAEEACKQAKPILVNAVLGITIADAVGILKGDSTAATAYLKRTTSADLNALFKPIVHDAVAKFKLTSYWEPIANIYNKLTILTGGKAVNPNLDEYITQKAIDGLFVLIADEEANIRKNPAARVTELLRFVFGSV